MRKLVVPIAAALLGLAACGQGADNEAAEANEVAVGDSNAMGEAVEDVNAAEAAAFNDAQAVYDNVAASVPAGANDSEIVD